VRSKSKFLVQGHTKVTDHRRENKMRKKIRNIKPVRGRCLHAEAPPIIFQFISEVPWNCKCQGTEKLLTSKMKI